MGHKLCCTAVIDGVNGKLNQIKDILGESTYASLALQGVDMFFIESSMKNHSSQKMLAN